MRLVHASVFMFAKILKFKKNRKTIFFLHYVHKENFTHARQYTLYHNTHAVQI